MSDQAIAAERFQRHRLARPGRADVADVVSWLGAVQAQDYHAAKWALGVRMRGRVTDADIETAFNAGRILRVHVLRPTWHFVSPRDIRWMLALTAPRVHQALKFGHRFYELTEPLKRRAARVMERCLEGQCLTRPEIAVRLARAGIAAKGVRLAFLSIHAELEGVICSGPRRGRESTYMLLDHRVPAAPHYDRDQALAELTTRFLQSHAPATARDFAWWSGLTMADVKRGLEIIRAASKTVAGLTYWTLSASRAAAADTVVHLLPVFDEYVVAYRDQVAVPRGKTSGGFLPQAIVSGGQVIGTWKISRQRDSSAVTLTLRRKPSLAQHERLEAAADRFKQFAGIPVGATPVMSYIR